MEAGIGRFACIIHKLRRHVQLLELSQRLVTHQHVFRPENRCCIRNAIQRGVVREHQNIVRRHMQIELEIVYLHLRVFHTAAEGGQRFLREIPRAAAMRRDRGFSGDERIFRVILLQIFGIRPMIKLRGDDDRKDDNDAEQHEQAFPNHFLCFH